MIRPGVPTTIWGPRSRFAKSSFSRRPPISTVASSPAARAKYSSTVPTWAASSRVGTSTIVCASPIVGSHSSIAGIPNATVLPVPVCA